MRNSVCVRVGVSCYCAFAQELAKVAAKAIADHVEQVELGAEEQVLDERQVV